MAELPYMPYVPTEYLGDTRHLTTLEHGAYHLLMLEYWIKGAPLIDDDKRLSCIVGLPLKDWKRIRATIAEFFICDGVTWIHKRIELDLAAARDKVKKARAAGMASGRARRGKGSGRERTFNGRSRGVQADVQRALPPSSNLRATNHKSKIIPLTPKNADDPPRQSDSAPGSCDDRALSEPRSIGELLKNTPKQEKTHD